MTQCLHSQLSVRLLGKNLRSSMHNSISSRKAVRLRRAAGGCFITVSHLALHLTIATTALQQRKHLSGSGQAPSISNLFSSLRMTQKFQNTKRQVRRTVFLSQCPLYSIGQLCINFLFLMVHLFAGLSQTYRDTALSATLFDYSLYFLILYNFSCTNHSFLLMHILQERLVQKRLQHHLLAQLTAYKIESP